MGEYILCFTILFYSHVHGPFAGLEFGSNPKVPSAKIGKSIPATHRERKTQGEERRVESDKIRPPSPPTPHWIRNVAKPYHLYNWWWQHSTI